MIGELSDWQRTFIDELQDSGSPVKAAKKAGVSRQVANQTRKHNALFAALWNAATQPYDPELPDREKAGRLIAEAWRRAVHGVDSVYKNKHGAEVHKRVYSDALLIVLLKAFSPERFVETYRVEHADASESDVEREIRRLVDEMEEAARNRAAQSREGTPDPALP